MATASRTSLDALITLCPVCKGSGWVCEDHPNLPFMHSEDCDAEGRKCRCNPTAAMPPDVAIVAALPTLNNVAVDAPGEDCEE